MLRPAALHPPVEPVELRAGLLTARFADGALLDVTVGADLVLDRTYVALRDRDWGTLPLHRRLTVCDIGPDRFTIGYDAQPLRADFPFWCSVRFSAAEGVLRMTTIGEAHGELFTNRIGFCLLHPLELAGTPVEFSGDPGGSGEFPERISPTVLFGEASGLRYSTRGGHRIEMAFDGDLFETEDQRNWIDGSYKTYCTPLRLSYPRRLVASDRVEQTITVRYPATAAPASNARVKSRRAVVVVGTGTWQRPELGVGVAAGAAKPAVAAVAQLRPAQLSVELDLRHDWTERWAQAAVESATYGVPLDALLVVDAATALEAWASAAARAGCLARVGIYSAGSHVSDERDLIRLRTALTTRGLDVQIGGGTRAHFADLNRMTVPLNAVDYLTYSATPQVHASDVRSIMQTPPALARTVADARALSGGRPIEVGPITFAPRFNSVATSAESSEQPDPDECADDRQPGPVVAAWTVGALAALAGAARANLFQVTGPHGVMAPGGEPFDVFRVLAWWAEQPATMSAVHADGAVHCLAARSDGATNVLLASTGDAPGEVEVRIADGTAHIIELAPLELRALRLDPDGTARSDQLNRGEE